MPHAFDPQNSDNHPPNPDHRITVSAARKMLGMVGRNYSDADIQEILSGLYGIAELGHEISSDLDGEPP